MVLTIVLLLIAAKLVMEFWLNRLNRHEVKAHADEIPDAFRDSIDAPTYRKAVDYTLARGRFEDFQMLYDTAILVLILSTFILPVIYRWFGSHLGPSAPAEAAFLFSLGILLAIPSLPVDWVNQFKLEQRFGFNTTTQKIWWLDRAKGLILALLIGYPLLILILKLVQWTGPLWWLWAWAVVLAFQLLMVVLAPILILPLFNKFTPLPEGSLRERLLRLGERTGFHSQTIQVMDGSKRSRHSNAFFTGFGRFRKIILFDTLINQLSDVELEAVLAHEIGHYKKKHIPKMLAASAIGLLIAFYVIAWIARQPWFYRAFGFEPGSIVPALLLFSLLSGVVTFWFGPLVNLISRKFEYQADAYAAETMREPNSLIHSLRQLNEKNLSNLTPHPLYSAFYYSHPTLLERESALRREGQALPSAVA
ncbi:MAG TPA: M48 family metallopeptidase [Verrucomicrobiae bacterium]|nr:M48 family metallopeptidase [Verrucomicrobiae bacterium]